MLNVLLYGIQQPLAWLLLCCFLALPAYAGLALLPDMHINFIDLQLPCLPCGSALKVCRPDSTAQLRLAHNSIMMPHRAPSIYVLHEANMGFCIHS